MAGQGMRRRVIELLSGNRRGCAPTLRGNGSGTGGLAPCRFDGMGALALPEGLRPAASSELIPSESRDC